MILASTIAAVELELSVAAAILAFLFPRGGLRFFGTVKERLTRIASRPLLCGLLVAFLPLVIRFALLPWVPPPAPAIQEEFSNLLEADTFAHGRLANPPHPMSVFFDDVQIVQYPKYVSARLPGTAIFLWLGEVLLGHPWFGVWVAVAAMCAAFYWMLLGWTRPLWALIVAILFALRFGIFSYWMNSYWPGSPAALGGALVLGATPRLYRRPSLFMGFVYAIGAVILVMNRPAEGVLFIAPTAIAIPIAWFRGQRPIRFSEIAMAVIPIVGIAGLSVAGLLWYNSATTGCARIAPYTIWRDGQAIVPTFWWQPLRRVDLVYYSQQTWEFFHKFEKELYDDLNRGWARRIHVLFGRLVFFTRRDLGLFLLIPLLFPVLNRRVRNRRFWLVFYFFAVGAGLLAFYLYFRMNVAPEFVLLGLYAFALAARFGNARRTLLPLVILLIGFVPRMLTSFSMPTYYPHYLAPVMILVAEGFRRMYVWARRQHFGAALARNVCLACGAMAVFQAAIPVSGHHVAGEDPFYMASYESRLADREDVLKFLASKPGEQLAIVRYGPKHDCLYEWVWNGAAVDSQKVIWARELKPEWTSQLLRYYAGRRVWLVQPDARPVRVTPYPVSGPAYPATVLPPAVYVGTPTCH